jgi:hypothetical protein
MPTAREIAVADPELRRLRQSGRVLTFLTPAVILLAILFWGQMAGKLLGACGLVLLVVATTQLLTLGRRIEAIQKGPQPQAPAVPAGPPLFKGFLGILGLLFLICSAAALVVTILQIFGFVHLGPVWWLPFFFALMFGFVGLLQVGIGHMIAKSALRTKTLRESGLYGSARILNVAETGTTINDQPEVRCTLEVSLPGEGAYTTVITSLVPIIKVGLLTSPNPVPVRVNPSDRNDILIEW